MEGIDRSWNDRLFYRSKIIQCSVSLRKAIRSGMSRKVIEVRRNNLDGYRRNLHNLMRLP